MKQVEDIFTAELLPLAKRGRGRPPSAKSKTAAERKKHQRERLAEEGKVLRTYTLSVELVAALDKFVLFKDEDRNAVVERLLRDRLMRKR